MALITTSSAPKALWPGINAWYGASYNEFDVQYKSLFDIETSRRAYEEDVASTGFGLASIKPEGQSISYDDSSQSYITRYTHVRYALGFMITHEAMADNLYDVVGKRGSQDLAFSMRQTKEIVGANVYNRAFDAGFVGGDNSAMIVNNHANFTGGDQSNLSAGNAALSEASLEQACIDMAKWTTDRGLLINVMPTSLIVPSELQFEAKRILGSEGRTTANLVAANPTFTSGATNDINAINAMGKFSSYTVNNYLTSPTAWFMRTNVKNGTKMFERESMVFAPDNDFDTENSKYKATERYAFGWTDWKGIYGSAGA
tara:strand:- start:3033 stop:3977 length:945 start_codon:yes stop_codon:yes gene_type:complete